MQLEESEYYASIVDKGTLDAIASGGNIEHVSNEHIIREDDWEEQYIFYEEMKKGDTSSLMRGIYSIEITPHHTIP